MWPLIAALFAQELVSDSAGGFVLARYVNGNQGNPPFLTKFVEGGSKLGWTVLPLGGRGAMTLGAGDSVFYVNEKGLEQFSPDGRLIVRSAIAWECGVRVWSARMSRSAQLLVTGQAECAMKAVGNAARVEAVAGSGNSFTAAVEPRGGAIRWLVPNVGGGLVEELGDGTLLLGSREKLSVAKLSGDGATLLGRVVLGGDNEEAPSWLGALPDGRIGVGASAKSNGLVTSLDAGQREHVCPNALPCTSGYLAVLDSALSRVAYASYLATKGNLATVLGVRVRGERAEVWGSAKDSRKSASPWFERFCPGYTARLGIPLASLTAWELETVPSQVVAQSLWLEPGSAKFAYAPDHKIDAVLGGDLNAPEADFCVYSAIDGEPSRDLVAQSYYSIYFGQARPGAKVTLNGEAVATTYESPAQINFRIPQFFFQGILAVDGVPYFWAQRLNRFPVLLNADPFAAERPRVALVTDERGQVLSEGNAAGPGERIFVYGERGARIVIRSVGDEYPDLLNYYLLPVRATELPGFPNLFVYEIRVPEGRPTKKARKFYIGTSVTGGGPDGTKVTWLRLQY